MNVKHEEEDEIMAKEGSRRANVLALLSGAVAGAIMWSKRDGAKGVMSLKKPGNPGWAKISDEPEVYLTASTEAGQQALFDYLGQSTPWRLVDHIADGFFWINDCEEILLLSQTPIMMGKYWTWSASRRFAEVKPCVKEAKEAAAGAQ